MKRNSCAAFIGEMFLKYLTRAHTGDRPRTEVKIMKRLALPIILILALVLVTAFGCVQDENVPETPPGSGQTNIGRLDFMTAGVTQRYDEMMTESGIEHEFYLTNGGHDFSTWSDGLHTFVLNIFGAGDSAD